MSDLPYISPSNSTALVARGAGRKSPVSDIDDLDARGSQILILSVDIGDGRSDQIQVHENDEPEDLAKVFCKMHGLSSPLWQALSLQIESNIEKLVEDQWKNVCENSFGPRPCGSPLRSKNSLSPCMKSVPSELSLNRRLFESFTDRPISPIHSKENYSVTSQKPSNDAAKLLRVVSTKKIEKTMSVGSELTFSPKIITRYRAMSNAENRVLTERRSLNDLKAQVMKRSFDYQDQVCCPIKPKVAAGSRALTKKRSQTAVEKVDQLLKDASELAGGQVSDDFNV